MLRIDSEKLPKAIAARLRRELAAHGIRCGQVKSLNLAACLLLGNGDWAGMKKMIGESLLVEDDSELDTARLDDRRANHIRLLTQAGCTTEIAKQVLDKVQPTGRRATLGPEAFDAEDDLASTGIRPPGWRETEEQFPTLSHYYDAADGMLVRNDPVGTEERLSLFRDRATGQFSIESVRERMREMARRMGIGVIDTPNGTVFDVNDLRKDEDIRRHRGEFNGRLLAMGAASMWEARDVRATRKGPDGKWQAAPGRLVATVTLPNGSEQTTAVSELFSEGQIDGMRITEFQTVTTSKGLAVVRVETREPAFLLRRKDPPRENADIPSGWTSVVAFEKEVRQAMPDDAARAGAMSVAAWKRSPPVAQMIFEKCLDDALERMTKAERQEIGLAMLERIGHPELEWPSKGAEILRCLSDELASDGSSEQDASRSRVKVNTMLGHYYQGEIGGHLDRPLAVDYFEKAGEAGHATAAYNAAFLLLEGEEPDLARAEKLLRMGAAASSDPMPPACSEALGAIVFRKSMTLIGQERLAESLDALHEAIEFGSEEARDFLAGLKEHLASIMDAKRGGTA